MDWTAALTLVFAGIGALGTVYTVADGFTKRRADQRARAEAEAQAWSLTAKPNPDIDGWTLQVRYEAPQEAPMTLVSMRLTEPQGATLSRAEVVRTRGEGRPLVSADNVWSEAIDLGVEMTPGYRVAPGEIRQMGYTTRSVVCRLPDSAKAGKIRFRASLTIEDNSAARRQSSFIVASQEIAWTASSADKAT